MTYSSTSTETYTTSDIEAVLCCVTADLMMIAESSGAIPEATARKYGHDIELLAKNNYLEKVDITLLSAESEVKAICYEVNTLSGNLMMSRPGGVLWPKVAAPFLRIVVSYNGSYTDKERQKMSGKLKISWIPSNADTSHSGLKTLSGRDYVSNGYGMQRKDFGL